MSFESSALSMIRIRVAAAGRIQSENSNRMAVRNKPAVLWRLMPLFVSREVGFSNYGNHETTLVSKRVSVNC